MAPGILLPSQVHTAFLPLELPAEAVDALAATLSAEERARANRFAREHLRRRFIAARGQLRVALAGLLAARPADLQFTYSSQGKPALGGALADSGLHFNLSHAEEVALLGATRAGPVGVDVERVRPLSDLNALVSRFFAPRERDAFLGLDEARKPEAFFHLWTRKEAWLKATGDGLGGGLDQVEVSFLPGEPARFVRLPGDAVVGDWSLHEIPAPAGYLAAVAVRQAHVQRVPWPGRSDTSVAPQPPYCG